VTKLPWEKIRHVAKYKQYVFWASVSNIITRVDITTLEQKEVQFSNTPTALFVFKGHCFVGCPGGRVYDIDFNAQDPKEVLLFNYGHDRKEIHSFAVCDDLLVAVDNLLSIKYGWVFKLDKDGNAEYLSQVTLGSGVYLQYGAAASGSDMIVISGNTFSGYSGRHNVLHFFKQIEAPKILKQVYSYRESSTCDQIGLSMIGNTLFVGKKYTIDILKIGGLISSFKLPIGYTLHDLTEYCGVLYALLRDSSEGMELWTLVCEDGKLLRLARDILQTNPYFCGGKFATSCIEKE